MRPLASLVKKPAHAGSAYLNWKESNPDDTAGIFLNAAVKLKQLQNKASFVIRNPHEKLQERDFNPLLDNLKS